MNHRHIIFVPGKNPKPAVEQHVDILWRVLVEGVKRAAPDVVNDLSQYKNKFEVTAWNYLYYHETKDINRDLPWIDALQNQHAPTEKDIEEANSTHYKLLRILYGIVDYVPFLLRIIPGVLKSTAEEVRRYFKNDEDIACDIRKVLKDQLRPLLKKNEKVLLIGHSLGSVIAYDALWELSHDEKILTKVDLFLTLGSPLGMNYVQKRLKGHEYTAEKKYPANIQRWVNIAGEGDITALDRCFADDFSEMKDLHLIDDIEDHCKGIYNFFRNEEGLNTHRSYGYLVNPAVGKVIADWWMANN
ncbi:MAG: GPI inositol-deacylase [Gammaproteobacteria bacterium]|nr:GPI inositol-deacylase [Gammaproteobacteria bacterium]MCW8986853.1 GPI inositol-deacylase [Gammaproteobacteria bacterium]MCW9031148.1 GPI inositol-deacylase [Gammaproteobacteria bacterium]